MKIIIEIPDEVYTASQIIDVKYEDVMQIPLEVIANGVPIDELIQEIMAVNTKDIPLEPIQPKELHRVGMGYDYDDWGCPNCECWLAGEPNIDGIPKRCPNCGQLLDLSKLRRQSNES